VRFDGSFSAGIRFAMKFSCRWSRFRGTGIGAIAMLVLSRRRNEKVVFPTLGITIEVRRIAGNRVQLAIAAPANIPVFRNEVLERRIREATQNGFPKSA
jgi:carbon storage regulator CsrA